MLSAGMLLPFDPLEALASAGVFSLIAVGSHYELKTHPQLQQFKFSVLFPSAHAGAQHVPWVSIEVL